MPLSASRKRRAVVRRGRAKVTKKVVRKARPKRTGKVYRVKLKKRPEGIAAVSSDRWHARDLEELAVMDLMGNGTASGNTVVQDLVLSLTGSTRKLGYSFGFSVGRQMNRFGNSNMEALFDALGRLGMGRVLYYPSLEQATITAIGSKASNVALGVPVHVMEAGIIAGYLSGYLGVGMRAREILCIYMGSDVCQFVAERVEEPDYGIEEHRPEARRVIKAIAERIGSGPYAPRSHNGEGGYHLVLPYMPLIRKQMLNESANVLYLAGEELAKRSGPSDYRDALRRMAGYFDLAGVEIRESKGKRVIRLKYKRYNSIDGLVELSSSMFSGFLETMFRSESKRQSGIGSNRAYFVQLTV